MFQAEIGRLEEAEREDVMQIVTSWMEQGIEQGIERGIEQGIEQGIEREKSLILRQLTRRVGEIPDAMKAKVENLSITQLEDLGEALLDFSQLADLETWLEEHL